MSRVIDIKGGRGGSGPRDPDEHIICQKPLRLRWGDWHTPHVIQVHVGSAALYEHQREQDLAAGRRLGYQMPSHFTLDGGMHETALALMRHRHSEESLRQVGFLAGLMECLINVPCAILRTDLIRRVYQEVQELSRQLGLAWRGRVGHFMLPVMEDAQDPKHLEIAVRDIDNLKGFFTTVRAITDRRYTALAKDFVIYYPRRNIA